MASFTGESRVTNLGNRSSLDLFLTFALLAIGLAVALVANCLTLPLGLDRYSGLLLGASLAAVLVVMVWPELALPVLVTSAGLLDAQLGGERVRHLVLVKLALLGAAGLAMLFSTLHRPGRFTRVRTPADLPALLLVCYTAASAAYGRLARGYDLDLVAVAGYHLSQLALYHFVITTSLGRPQAFRRAGAIIVVWSLLWILPSLALPGRGGGTSTTWLIVLLCYGAASRARWTRLAWLAAPFALLDTVTCGYRTLWVTLTGQLSWLAGLRLRAHRVAKCAVALLLGGAVLVALAVSQPELFRAIPAADTLSRFASSLTDPGYRLPEAALGLQAFAERPLFGRGVGYQTPVRWVEPMGFMAVGPIHHMYYVSYLANGGVIGLALVGWYFLAVLFSGPARRMRQRAAEAPWAAVGAGLQAALFGAILGAFFAGPSDGHWTWGVLGAGSLLPALWPEGESVRGGEET